MNLFRRITTNHSGQGVSFRHALLWIGSFAVIGLLCSGILLLFVPMQYQASGVIKPAKVGSFEGGRGGEVEPVSVTLERLKLPSFYSKKTLDGCNYESGATLARDIRAKVLRNNSLIQIEYNSTSSEQAKNCLSYVLEQLKDSQRELAAPITKIMIEQAALTKSQLNQAEQFQAQIAKKVISVGANDVLFGQAMLMLSASMARNEELANLRKRYNEQMLQLSEPYTQDLALLEPMYVPSRAVFPNVWMFLMTGAIAGVLLGLAVLSIRKNRAE